jgi:hypothetical protein
MCLIDRLSDLLPALRGTWLCVGAVGPQTQLQETQRLKQVVDMECQKATAAAMHAKALDAQLTASTAALQNAQQAQFELQQQVRSIVCTASRMPRHWHFCYIPCISGSASLPCRQLSCRSKLR